MKILLIGFLLIGCGLNPKSQFVKGTVNTPVQVTCIELQLKCPESVDTVLVFQIENDTKTFFVVHFDEEVVEGDYIQVRFLEENSSKSLIKAETVLLIDHPWKPTAPEQNGGN